MVTAVVGACLVVSVTWFIRGKRRGGPPATPAAPAPQQLGPYQLISLLGEGAMATVYQARDSRDGRLLAIKVVRQEHQDNPEFQLRFQREAQLALQLRHPHLVEVYGAVQLQGKLCMAMEWVDGCSLEALLEQGPLPLERFRPLAIQLLSALHFAHKRHLFHRDIKPANIMLTAEGNAKILDFGLAIEEGQSRFTSLGFSMGTPTHMAPEMLTHGVSDAHTDQYALGVVFYQILTGRCPFIHRNPMHLGLMHVQQQPPALASLRPEIPAGWRKIVERMLEKEPKQRFGDLSQVQVLLSQE